jgi:hypothetical protein
MKLKSRLNIPKERNFKIMPLCHLNKVILPHIFIVREDVEIQVSNDLKEDT